MLFNSFHFVWFLPLIFVLYWVIPTTKIKFQNALLLLASFYFYSCWDIRFTGLLTFSILLDYFTGIQIGKATTDFKRKGWFWLSICINLGFLAVFKYYNFFATSFSELFHTFGISIDPWLISVVLPVGISFYTFHGLSYVIDIYKQRIQPEKSFVDYAVFVSFFPLLVAGPIERATHLLPQIKTQRIFQKNQAVDGLRQILWGFFKKLVIADMCAEYANLCFSTPENYSSSALLLGAVCFAFQIYGDFSGYSDIALGTARLFGFELLRNFSFPYFSRDIAEFWRRWHISLSSWFRDYLYIPLGGNVGSLGHKIKNTFIIFLVSGFWHGANWTFIFWGGLNALFFLPLLLRKKNKTHVEIVAQESGFPSLKEVILILFTFSQVVFAWIFFRAESLPAAFSYLSQLFTKTLFTLPRLLPLSLICLILFFFAIEWLGRRDQFAIQKIGMNWPRVCRWGFYVVLIFLISMFMKNEHSSFIYFQF